MIESWQLTDRQRLLDTSLSMSELNALGGVTSTRKFSRSSPPPKPPPLAQAEPPPRPPETYRQQILQIRAHTEEPQRVTRKASRGPSARFLGFLRRPDSRIKQQQKDEEIKNESKNGGQDYQKVRVSVEREEEERELLEVAAELKWLIAENTRQLADLCQEERVCLGVAHIYLNF